MFIRVSGFTTRQCLKRKYQPPPTIRLPPKATRDNQRQQEGHQNGKVRDNRRPAGQRAIPWCAPNKGLGLKRKCQPLPTIRLPPKAARDNQRHNRRGTKTEKLETIGGQRGREPSLGAHRLRAWSEKESTSRRLPFDWAHQRQATINSQRRSKKRARLATLGGQWGTIQSFGAYKRRNWSKKGNYQPLPTIRLPPAIRLPPPPARGNQQQQEGRQNGKVRGYRRPIRHKTILLCVP